MMSGFDPKILIPLSGWSGEVIAVLVVVGALAVLVSRCARAVDDVLALIARARAHFGAHRHRPGAHDE
ncbi:MAG TPA: hypothetical protein VFO41_14590 [Alphaproteobacteria bacterium]|nr:hypothetical protein [Alphaproteobacteria bacterium]